MRRTDLAFEIGTAWGSPVVDELSNDTFIVRLPTHRFEHDDVSLLVVRDSADPNLPWRMSDDGLVAFLLGEAAEETLDRLADAPLLWGALKGNELVSRSSDSGLGLAVTAFAHQIRDVLTAAHTLDAVRLSVHARRNAASSARLIAREMKSQLARAVPRVEPLFEVDRKLALGHGVANVRVPLAMNQPRGNELPPLLVAAAMDFTGHATAIRSNLGTTSLVMDFAAQVGIKRRFLIFRGDRDERAELSSLYDRENVVLVPTDEPDVLIESVRELAEEFALN